MTPQRKKALQWFHDRGEVCGRDIPSTFVSIVEVQNMINDGSLSIREDYYVQIISLTDKGRRALNGDYDA